MTPFAADSWHRALSSLASAGKLAATDPDSAASRAYYAAFHAVSALFAERGMTFLKHSQLRTALHRDLVKTGEWDPELGQTFDFLLDLRETGDYGGQFHVSYEDATEATQMAARIINRVGESLGFEDPLQEGH